MELLRDSPPYFEWVYVEPSVYQIDISMGLG